jgi:molecular chaperone GrpE (heat shock protein)
MVQSPRELAAQTAKIQRDQERLYQDLLGILDALEHACSHWQQAEIEHREMVKQPSILSEPPVALPSASLLQHWRQQFQVWLSRSSIAPTSVSGAAEAVNGIDSMTEVLGSAREGVEMIRRSLLDILRRHQVEPIEVLGETFDPSRMYALGREEREDAEENTVIREVVRGYRWQNRLLRESQVMVSAKPSGTEGSD